MFGKYEPLINASTVSSIVSAVLAAAVAFNVPITDDQRNALLALVVAIGAIFWTGTVVARNQVTPVDKVEENIIPLVAPHNQAIATESLNSGEKSVRAEVLDPQ